MVRRILALLLFLLGPTAESLAADGPWLYYQQGAEILRTRADGTASQRVATLDGPASRFWFSPDGKRLVATGSYGPDTGVRTWVVDSAGKDQRPTGLSSYMGAEPSPDGKWLAAVIMQEEDEVLAILPASGGDARVLTPAYPPSKPYPTRLLWFDWSADGRYLAYTVLEDGFPWGWGSNLYTVRTDGTRLRRVGAPGRGFRVEWAPRGERLAFLQQDRVESTLFTVKPDGRKLTEISPQAGQFAWSPDGQLLIYLHKQFDLLAVRPDGTGHKELLHPDRTAYPAAWNSRGDRMVVHVSGWWGEPGTLHVLHPGKAEPVWQPLTGNNPVWSPDGQSLFYTEGYSHHVRTPEGDLVLPVSGNLFADPHWSPDGHRLALPMQRELAVIDVRSQEVVTITPGESAVIGWLPLPAQARSTGQGALWLLPLALLLLLNWTRPVTKKVQKLKGG